MVTTLTISGYVSRRDVSPRLGETRMDESRIEMQGPLTTPPRDGGSR